MTVRFSPRAVFAFVALSVAVATWLPVTAPREFDRAVRSGRASPLRPGWWDAGPYYGEDHAESPAVTVSEGGGISSTGRQKDSGQALDTEVSPIASPHATSHVRVGTGAWRPASRGFPAPIGRAPPHARRVVRAHLVFTCS